MRKGTKREEQSELNTVHASDKFERLRAGDIPDPLSNDHARSQSQLIFFFDFVNSTVPDPDRNL
jgi:hypothetical protein